ncbi:hypothetical protein DFH27DRAFT_604678 [Peziza echinospora]|nr:hypothetical protein DFH27DRAFT_604678 [Peziza echinospora]
MAEPLFDNDYEDEGEEFEDEAQSDHPPPPKPTDWDARTTIPACAATKAAKTAMPLIKQNDHNYPNVARLSKDDLHAQLLLLDIKPEELDKVLERLVTARKINPHRITHHTQAQYSRSESHRDPNSQT